VRRRQALVPATTRVHNSLPAQETLLPSAPTPFQIVPVPVLSVHAHCAEVEAELTYVQDRNIAWLIPSGVESGNTRRQVCTAASVPRLYGCRIPSDAIVTAIDRLNEFLQHQRSNQDFFSVPTRKGVNFVSLEPYLLYFGVVDLKVETSSNDLFAEMPLIVRLGQAQMCTATSLAYL
jgi:hypothetical protein